ncbi:hypothetical protein D3C75_447520 [compost metagenome]
MKLFIHIEGTVIARDRIFIKQRIQEVIRVTIVTGPAEHIDIILFSGLGVIEIGGPFGGLNDGVHTDFFPIGLNSLGYLFAVRHVRAGYRHCIEGYCIRQTVRITGFCQQRLRFVQIVFIILHGIIIAPQ